MRVCPCFKCKVHTSICKLICKDHKEWTAEDLKQKEAEAKAKDIIRGLDGHIVDIKDKARRRRKYKW